MSMRNLLSIIVMFCLTVTISMTTSCSSNTITDQQTSNTDKTMTIPTDSGTKNPVICQPKIPVGSENFTKLVDFIEKNGFVTENKGIPSDHQYTFIDSQKNRHALITIKRDDNGQPSVNGKVKQISVWAYEKGIKSQEKFFGYGITQDSVFSFLEGEEHFLEIKLGYEEFTKKATSK